MDETTGLGIGEVAARTALSEHTLRFYEREGIFTSPIRRTAAGRRVYTEDDVAWLETCANFRASGMRLETIRTYAALVREGPGNEEERLSLLRAHRKQVTTRIAELTKCLDLITYKIGVYETHLTDGTATDLWVHTRPETARIYGTT